MHPLWVEVLCYLGTTLEVRVLQDPALVMLRGQLVEIISGTVFVFIGLAVCAIAAIFGVKRRQVSAGHQDHHCFRDRSGGRRHRLRRVRRLRGDVHIQYNYLVTVCGLLILLPVRPDCL